MRLDLSSLTCGDRVRLCRAISGYDAGTIGTVVEVLSTQKEAGLEAPAVLVEWPLPAGRFGFNARPTRDEFTQKEQEDLGFLERL